MDFSKVESPDYQPKAFSGNKPVIARLDGKNFTSFLKHCHKPFDPGFSALIMECAALLTNFCDARLAFVGSDEISLLFKKHRKYSTIFAGGRLFKMASILASKLTYDFNSLKQHSIFGDTWARDEALFDCRVFEIEDSQVHDYFWGRQQSIITNSVAMLARHHFSHKELLHVSVDKRLDMLLKKGINWNDESHRHKYGTFFYFRKVSKPFTKKELSKLPLKHDARTIPDLKVTRRSLEPSNVVLTKTNTNTIEEWGCLTKDEK